MKILQALAPLVLVSPAAAQAWLTPPTAPPENPVTPAKAVLGKILFWDEQLSSDGSVACGTCHVPSVGGSESRAGMGIVNPGPDGVFGTADDSFGSPGVVGANAFGHFAPRSGFGLEAQVTSRYSPSAITGAYFDELFWDGRAAGEFVDPVTGATVIASGGALESQSLGPLLSDVEMADEDRSFDDLVERLARVEPLALAANLPADVVAALASDSTYGELFEAAFGTDEITPVRIAFALATYQRTLVPDQTPFDDYQRGDTGALTPQQENGWFAFQGSTTCAICHTPPLFSDGRFHSIALRPSAEDLGRALVTGNPVDAGTFKTPSLRNVALRNHWFHNGAPSMTELRDTVAIYGTGVGGGFDNLDILLDGLVLSQQQIDDVTAFMEALTDPRVAAETPPFDRPTLRFERGTPNPRPLGQGAVAGSGGAVPEVIVTASPFLGADRFRLGVRNALGGSFAAVRLRLVDLGGFAGNGGPLAIRELPLPDDPIRLSNDGIGTWSFPLTSTPALQGLVLDAQWWVRDSSATGGLAKSEAVRITVE
ncbi:MAG: cytochrome c peroxidase [Planctomycetota bacterium]